MRRLGSQVVFGFMLLAGTAFSAADVRAAGTIEEAKQWFAEGDKAEADGDCTTAVAKFRLALGVKETPQLYLRIGRCQEKLGLLADALGTYQAGRPLAAGNDKVLGVIDGQISQVELRVPKVAFELPSSVPDGLKIAVNKLEVANPYVEFKMNAGDADVTATAPGKKPFHEHLTVAPGERKVVFLKMETLDTEPVKSNSPKPSILGISLIGGGAVAIGIGIGLAVEGFSLQGDLNKACNLVKGEYVCPGATPTVDGEAPQSVVDKSNAFKGAAWGLLGVGAAAAAVGGVFLGLSLKSHAAPAVSVVPVVSPTFSGAVLGGQF